MRLYQRDIDFLLANISDKKVREKLLQTNETLDSGTERVSILFSKEDLLVIEDRLGDLLAAKGITDGEINAYGKKIESLIDMISNDFLSRFDTDG